jgi:hypothetical protein
MQKTLKNSLITIDKSTDLVYNTDMTNNDTNKRNGTKMITKLDKSLTINFVFDSLSNETILNPSFFVIGLKLNKAMKTNGIATRHFSDMMQRLEDKITLRKETLEKA